MADPLMHPTQREGHAMMLKAPFPYFGGKRAAAHLVWQRLGDVGGYVEPFAGSAAVLLARPAFTGRRVETINDKDGLLVNFWRAIQHDPQSVARLAAGPVIEVDKVARNAYLLDWREDNLPRLYGDPVWFDTQAAAWWVYVMCAAIGNPFDGGGPWRSVVCDDGARRLKPVSPRGVDGVENGSLLLSHAGHGVNGVGVRRGAIYLSGGGRGVHSGKAAETTLTHWFQQLRDRLQDVRITCGDWTKPLRDSSINATSGPTTVGIFLDPPYETGNNIYDGAGNTISQDVETWCLNANPQLRIALCGYNDEHDKLLDHGWTVETSKASSGGYGAVTATTRERIWFSPACLTPGLW